MGIALLFALLAAPVFADSRVLALTFQALGTDGEIRTVVRDLAPEADPKSQAPVLDAGLAAIRAFEAQLAQLPTGDGAPHPFDERLLALLDRARDACFWSEGILAPFGHGPALPAKGPRPEGPAACFRAEIDRKKGTATLANGAVLDLHELAAGYAVDLAVAAMRAGAAGIAPPDNGWVRLGTVQRSFGIDLKPGVGKWVDPPAPVRRLDPEFRGFYLSDRALAVAASTDDPPHVDQRTGTAPTAAIIVLAVAELAVDAQLLAATMLTTGSRSGELRLGSIRPNPSILWVYGSGNGLPLYIEHGWSALQRRAP
jgi:hypothetical protein